MAPKVISSDLSRLAETDGHTSWRKKEAKDLSDLVQARIRALQNPEDCDSAKKLLCSLNKGCGFGCQGEKYNGKYFGLGLSLKNFKITGPCNLILVSGIRTESYKC